MKRNTTAEPANSHPAASTKFQSSEEVCLVLLSHPSAVVSAKESRRNASGSSELRQICCCYLKQHVFKRLLIHQLKQNTLYYTLMFRLRQIIANFNLFCFKESCSFHFVHFFSFVISVLHAILGDFNTCTILFSKGGEKSTSLSSNDLELRIRYLKEAILRKCILWETLGEVHSGNRNKPRSSF